MSEELPRICCGRCANAVANTMSPTFGCGAGVPFWVGPGWRHILIADSNELQPSDGRNCPAFLLAPHHRAILAELAKGGGQ